MPLPRLQLKLKRPAALNRDVATFAAISFSLTFAAVSLAFLVGLLPQSITILSRSIDVGVLLLVVPVCSLSLAILFEVLTAAIRGLPRIREPIDAPALSGWRPGQGEG